jgi:hypothetical protein
MNDDTTVWSLTDVYHNLQEMWGLHCTRPLALPTICIALYLRLCAEVVHYDTTVWSVNNDVDHELHEIRGLYCTRLMALTTICIALLFATVRWSLLHNGTTVWSFTDVSFIARDTGLGLLATPGFAHDLHCLVSAPIALKLCTTTLKSEVLLMWCPS